MIDTMVVTELANIGLTILALVIGWITIMWLDKNVFNRDRYNRFNEKDKK